MESDNKRATIYDIAQKAGVSIATVSRAFSGKGYVSPATKEKIMSVCDGYRPNTMPQQRPSRTIGILVSHGANYFFLNSVYNEAMVGISEVTKENGYYIMLDMDIESTDPCSLFLNGIVEGFVLMGVKSDSTLVARMQSLSIPFVIIGNYYGPCKNVAHVDIDDKKAVKEAVLFLIGLGHKEIGIITGDTSFASCRDRLAGYEEALREENIEIKPENILKCENLDDSKAQNLAKSLLLKRKPVTALMAFNDQVAVAAYSAAQELGIAIPRQLSIIGFDDSPIAKFVTPKMTTVWQPSYDKGARAAKLLIEALKNNRQPHENIILDTMMVYRDSCAKRS